MWTFVHQYAYFFSLLIFILPISVAFDASLKFRIIKKLTTPKGVLFVLISVIFWSLFDMFWIHGIGGAFPRDRVI